MNSTRNYCGETSSEMNRVFPCFATGLNLLPADTSNLLNNISLEQIPNCTIIELTYQVWRLDVSAPHKNQNGLCGANK
jgi:hypothetical protein